MPSSQMQISHDIIPKAEANQVKNKEFFYDTFHFLLAAVHKTNFYSYIRKVQIV